MEISKQIPRYLGHAIKKLAFDRQKMAFISVPRQVGKTTITRLLSINFDQVGYYNWDQTTFKKRWTTNPDSIVDDFNLQKYNESRLIILDEIHKSRNWKQKLKGIYDINSELVNIIVTGSARLNVYRKGQDSLLGRYLHFRLHPFSLRELANSNPNTPDQCYRQLFITSVDKKTESHFSALENLFKYGGFPEPFIAKDQNILNIWQQSRNEIIIKEDLRDLSQIKELGLIEVLVSLLPDKVGSPISVQSLREDLSVAHETVSRWLGYLKELYLFFEIRPFSRSIPRSIKKEGKIYFYDWTTNKNHGAKFENFVASHLLKACHYWQDTGEGNFALHYLRNKEKQEVDFLLTRNDIPWFTIECKYKNSSLDTSYKKFQSFLNCPHIQVVYDSNIFRKVDDTTWIIGADYFFMQFV